MLFTRHLVQANEESTSILTGRNSEDVCTLITNFGFVQGVPGELKGKCHSDPKDFAATTPYEQCNIFYLNNVVIYTYDGELIEVQHFIIFEHQLIGIISGRLFNN